MKNLIELKITLPVDFVSVQEAISISDGIWDYAEKSYGIRPENRASSIIAMPKKYDTGFRKTTWWRPKDIFDRIKVYIWLRSLRRQLRPHLKSKTV